MNLYQVEFVCGHSMQEYGTDETDLRDFLRRCYPQYTVKSISPYVSK